MTPEATRWAVLALPLPAITAPGPPKAAPARPPLPRNPPARTAQGDGPVPRKNGDGAVAVVVAVGHLSACEGRPAQPPAPKPIARYSLSPVLDGSLAYTCDMYRCPCE